MFENPYGWSTSPVQLPGRTRKSGIWISAWVDYGRPVIMDTGALNAPAFSAKHRADLVVDEQVRRRLAGGDTLPADCLLVILHPRMYRDLLMQKYALWMTGPDAAAQLIDGACLQTPGLAERMRWKVELPVNGDDI